MKTLVMLIILLLPLCGFAADNENPQDCLSFLNDSLAQGEQISILNKDRRSVTGYFQGVNSDTLLYTIVSPTNEYNVLKQVPLSQVDYLSYSRTFNNYKPSRARDAFVVGAVIAGAVAYGLDIGDIIENRKDDSSVNSSMIIGAVLGGGALSFLIYLLSSINHTEHYQIKCE